MEDYWKIGKYHSKISVQYSKLFIAFKDTIWPALWLWISKSRIKQSQDVHALFIYDQNATKMRNGKNLMKVMSSYKLISSLVLNAAINWRTKLAVSTDKLHCADSVYNPLLITAVAQDHGNGQESRHMPWITVIVIPWFSCSPNDPDRVKMNTNYQICMSKVMSLRSYCPHMHMQTID